MFVASDTICLFAITPTDRVPSDAKFTTLGIKFPPSAVGITFGSPCSKIETTEFVVPKSIPITGSFLVFTLSSDIFIPLFYPYFRH